MFVHFSKSNHEPGKSAWYGMDILKWMFTLYVNVDPVTHSRSVEFYCDSRVEYD